MESIRYAKLHDDHLLDGSKESLSEEHFNSYIIVLFNRLLNSYLFKCFQMK